MTTRTLRNRLITAGAVLSTAGLIFAGGLPAVAEESLEAPIITPTVEVTGWPEEHAFYAGETVTLNVHVDAGVVGAPSVEGMVAGLAHGGEMIAFGKLDDEGNALVSVRPLITGTLHFTPFFMGEGVFNDATGVGGDIEVNAVPVEASVWLDYMNEDGTTVGYGGATLDANVHIEPFCADEEDEAATDECYATYGVPTGTIALMRDGETIGEAVVEGPASDASFADVNADLSEGARPDWIFVPFTVPSIMLGSPDSFEVTAGFESDNWFTSEVAGPFTVEVEPFQTAIELYIDGTWSDEDPIRLNTSEVLLTANFQHGYLAGADATGTVEFFANGLSIGEVAVGEDGERADFLWNIIEGGEYVLSAVYTPDSLNHLGSATPEYSVLVTIPPVPNPTPVDPEPADTTPADVAKTDKAKAPQALANTGGSSTEIVSFMGIGLLLSGTAALILAGRRRV